MPGVVQENSEIYMSALPVQLLYNYNPHSGIQLNNLYHERSTNEYSTYLSMFQCPVYCL